MAAIDETSPDPYPLVGHVVEGKYEIREVLGSGAMGRVVRAEHQLRKIPVALKFVSPSLLGQKDVIERFLNEGVASSKIDSEHVVKVFDVSKLPNGVPYMVMELLEGEDLSRLLRREGTPYLRDPARAVHFTLQILRGLQAAHGKRIVHRDMKPANCFVVQRDGEPDFIKLVDFGISKVRAEGGMELTQATSALGTPLYMSLEQAKSPKDVDARTDLYSTGVILYELLAGMPPFVPDSDSLMELFSMLMNEDPRLLSEIRGDLPPGLDTVVRKSLAKDRVDRFQTAEEMAEALAPFADHRSDHVVSRLLRTVPGQHRSLRPPPVGVATTSEMPKSATGTMLMSNAPPASALPLTEKQGPRWADSGSGTAATTGGVAQRTVLEERRGTPLVFAIAIVAVAAVAAAAWGLGKLSSAQQGGAPTTAADPPPSGSPLQPTTTVSPGPPSATTEASGEPTAKVSASANVGQSVPSAPSAKPTLKDITRD